MTSWRQRNLPRLKQLHEARKLVEFSRDYISERLSTGLRKRRPDGYVYIHCPRHPASQYTNGNIAEHRLVVELRLGRFLNRGESVHHINGQPDDNTDSNLELWTAPPRYGIRNTDAVNWASDILQRNRPAGLAATDITI